MHGVILGRMVLGDPGPLALNHALVVQGKGTVHPVCLVKRSGITAPAMNFVTTADIILEVGVIVHLGGLAGVVKVS